MYPTHHFHQELARARYADMLREARMTNIEPPLEAELETPFARVRLPLAPQVTARGAAPAEAGLA